MVLVPLEMTTAVSESFRKVTVENMVWNASLIHSSYVTIPTKLLCHNDGF